MLDWNDPRWQTLKGGYRVPFDRTSPQNPVIPDWLAPAYFQSVGALARYCLQMLPATAEPLTVNSMLSFLTLWKGMRTHFRAFSYSEPDLIHYFDEC